MLNRQKLETRNQPVFDIHPLWRQKKEKAEILVWGREKTCIFKCSQADVLSEQPANDVEVHMQHMWPQALSVPTVKCLKANCAHRVRAVNPVCPADPVLQAVLPSVTSLYNSTDYSSKNNLPCTHWHTFFPPASPRSVAISSSQLTLVSSLPQLGYFHLTQLNDLSNMLSLFPSVSFHYLTLLPFSLLSLLVSLWLHPKIHGYYSPFLHSYLYFSLLCSLL